MLNSLYRSRRGDSREQLENFLSAALGQLLSCSAEAREKLAPLLQIPVSGEMRIATEETLFSGPEPVGRVDLRFDFRHGRGVRTVVVETKFECSATVEPLRRYREALDEADIVVLLSNRPRDREIAEAADCRHITWLQVVTALQPLTDPSSRQLVAFLATRGASSPGAMTVRELAAPAGIRQRLEGTIRDHLHLLIPAAFHRQLESFEPGNYLDFEAGYSIEAPEDEGELAIRSLAITADREELGGLTLKLWISTPHPALARQLVITDDGGCWQEDRDYLFAELGTFWGNRTLSSCLVEAIGRGRSLLRAPSQGHWPGLWLRVRQDEIAGNRMQGRVDELWTALEVASRVSDAARDLSRHWLLRIQELLGQKRCKRVSHHHGGSFFVDDGAFQVGAWIQPGDKGRHVAGWVYFRERRRRDLFAAAMERQGWRLDQDNDPKTVVVVPYLSEGTTLDLPLVDELAATLATTIDEVMR